MSNRYTKSNCKVCGLYKTIKVVSTGECSACYVKRTRVLGDCTSCGRLMPIIGKKHHECKTCTHRRWRENLSGDRLSKHRGKVNKRVLHKKLELYGVTESKYLEDLNSGCGICGCKENLVIDHNHETNVYRGVLCQTHNKALGAFGDNVEGLQQAILYLENCYKTSVN